MHCVTYVQFAAPTGPHISAKYSTACSYVANFSLVLEYKAEMAKNALNLSIMAR